MCYLKIYIKVYLMPKRIMLSLQTDEEWIEIKFEVETIQNGGDHKFCRLTSKVSLAIGILDVIDCFVAIIGSAAMSIVSAKSRNAHCFSG